jgi:hypothetical protein
MTSTTRPRTSTFLAAALLLASAAVARPAAAATVESVVQVDVSSVIDGRTVSTAQGQTITPWTAMQGVDGHGNADGYVTKAVETLLVGMGKTVGGKAGVALPDDGMFPPDPKGRFPAVQLHFSNDAPTTSPQTHQIYINPSRGSQSFMFDVPAATYSKMFLFITASEGAAKLAITFNYAGGTAPTTQTVMLPDYGVGGATNPNDPIFFNLIAGMRKWGSSDQEGDSTTHTITGIELAPNATATLASIKVEKMNGSHCVFWGATGIASGAVMTGAGGSTGGGTDGGAAGATEDAGGGAGAGGSTGSAGSTGGAGSMGAAGSMDAAGSTGAAGSTTGAAGSTNGAAGSAMGAAGSTAGAPGAAGSPTGGTGAAGAGGAKHSSGSSGGCALAGASSRPTAAWLLLAAALAIVVTRRRR